VGGPRREVVQRELVQETGGGLAPFLVCTVIWAVTGVSGYFWPAGPVPVATTGTVCTADTRRLALMRMLAHAAGAGTC
jgi:hypothetical protein